MQQARATPAVREYRAFLVHSLKLPPRWWSRSFLNLSRGLVRIPVPATAWLWRLVKQTGDRHNSGARPEGAELF